MPVDAVVVMMQLTAAVGVDAADFDLRKVKPTPGCSVGKSDEIVVCANRDDVERYRVRPLPAGPFDSKPVTATIDLGRGTTAGVNAERVEFPGGIVSNRAMITLKTKF